MLFNSFGFAIFLPAVFALYWACPKKFRYLVIFFSSYFFYAQWNAKYALLIFLVTAISYFCALACEKKRANKLPLIGAIILLLSILFTFKYANFFFKAFSLIFKTRRICFEYLLPVGISFYTFQAISYVVDVYKGKICAEKHFVKYAAFISFFPQLVAGPIERAENLLCQIKTPRNFDCEKATYGLKLMALGYVKKIVIADNIAKYVDGIFGNSASHEGFVFALAALYFAIQIYCDFSGYCDIAVGGSKLFGIDLSRNFESPYFSKSLKEFWRRWHITLGSWFRDYVYIPLGGNRCKKFRQCANLFFTLLLSGLWHGANWTFVAWGAFFGIFQVAENLFTQKMRTLKKSKVLEQNCTKKNFAKNALCILLTFCTVCALWILFRAQSRKDVAHIFCTLFTGISNPILYAKNGIKTMDGKKMFLLCTFFLFCYDALSLKFDCIKKFEKCPALLRWSVYVALCLLLEFSVFFQFANAQKNSTQFIYFQF